MKSDLVTDLWVSTRLPDISVGNVSIGELSAGFIDNWLLQWIADQLNFNLFVTEENDANEFNKIDTIVIWALMLQLTDSMAWSLGKQRLSKPTDHKVLIICLESSIECTESALRVFKVSSCV